MEFSVVLGILITIITNSPKLYKSGKEIFNLLMSDLGADETLTPEEKAGLIKMIEDAQASLTKWE